MRRGVIDIGTNSVKLLIAEVEGLAVSPLWEQSEQTRLGEGFYDAHCLQAKPIANTAAAVARFASKAREWNVASLRVIGTSAVRDAVNRHELLSAVESGSRLTVEVISGEQEADWAFGGVRTDPALPAGRLLILDVGGGSTEFILGQGAHPDFRASFPLGSVRMLEAMRVADPPAEADWQRCQGFLREFLTTRVQPLLAGPLSSAAPGAVHLIGTGGTTSILAAMELRLTAFDRARIEQTTLSRERVGEIRKLLWTLPLEHRRLVPGLPANRADVILFGVAIFLAVLETFDFDRIRVSTRGLRFGAALGS